MSAADKQATRLMFIEEMVRTDRVLPEPQQVFNSLKDVVAIQSKTISTRVHWFRTIENVCVQNMRVLC